MSQDATQRTALTRTDVSIGFIRAFSIVLALFLAVLPLAAVNDNFRLCVPQVVGLPVLTSPPPVDGCGHTLVANQPPIIDGCIIGTNPDQRVGDPGWTGAFRYVWGHGDTFPNAAVQGIKDNSFLYLSFEVNNDLAWDANDLVIIGLRPNPNNPSPVTDSRIHIYPFPNPSNLSAPPLVKYWTNSSTWNNPPTTPPPNNPTLGTLPATFQLARTKAGSGSNRSWYMEMRIPLGSTILPAGTPAFGLYFDVRRSDGPFLGATEYFWPDISHGVGDLGAEETSTPSPSTWGNLTWNPALSCYGVKLDSQDITSVLHPPDQIYATVGNTNQLAATPHNSSVDSTGTAIPANQITAKFSIANFGLPSNWTPVPKVTPPEVVGPVDLTANCGTPANPACNTFTTSSFSITDSGDILNYTNHPDQCILVELDSQAATGTPPDCTVTPELCTTFINKSARRNMTVLTTAQRRTQKAEISAKGYPGGAQEFVLRLLKREKVVRHEKEGEVLSVLTWAVDGCRVVGVKAKDQEYGNCEEVGQYAGVVQHVGKAAVATWALSLEGAGLSKVENTENVYRLSVQQDGVATVTTHFAPRESGKFAVFFDAGAGIPHGTFGSAFNTGFSLNTGLEYLLTSYASVEGIFGYHHFPGTITSDLNVYQFSANAKLYWRTYTWGGHPVRLFVNFGPGGYKFGSASTYGGGNVGAGLLYEFRPTIGLQGSYNLHAFNGPAGATEFSTFQGGIRFVF